MRYFVYGLITVAFAAQASQATAQRGMSMSGTMSGGGCQHSSSGAFIGGAIGTMAYGSTDGSALTQSSPLAQQVYAQQMQFAARQQMQRAVLQQNMQQAREQQAEEQAEQDRLQQARDRKIEARKARLASEQVKREAAKARNLARRSDVKK